MDVKEIVCEDCGSVSTTSVQGPMAVSCEHSNEPSGHLLAS
jgi:hypothetical protein